MPSRSSSTAGGWCSPSRRTRPSCGARPTTRPTGGGAPAPGGLEVKEIKIDPAAIDPEDPELLADMVLAAVNEGLRAAQELANEKLGATTGGLDLGALGGLGLPGM